MSGHLSFPQIESDGTPASLSKKFLTEILRNQLGYDGLIITDDMMMNGATLFAGSFHRAVMMAIEAGNDIIISSTTANLYDNMWTKNLEKMNSDEEFFSRVKDAARRVIFAKLKYFKSENHAPLYPDENKIYEYIPDKEGQKFFLEQACRSVSVLKRGENFPFVPRENERILIAGPFLSFYGEGRKRYPKVSTFHFSYELKNDESNFDSWNAASLTSVADGYDTIIICVYDRHTANIAKRLRYMDKKVIVFSIMSPVYVLNDFDWADTILCGYSYSSYSFAALFGALNGEFTPNGKVPLSE
jgi:beta-N-acetylhexosaminidase